MLLTYTIVYIIIDASLSLTICLEIRWAVIRAKEYVREVVFALAQMCVARMQKKLFIQKRSTETFASLAIYCNHYTFQLLALSF